MTLTPQDLLAIAGFISSGVGVFCLHIAINLQSRLLDQERALRTRTRMIREAFALDSYGAKMEALELLQQVLDTQDEDLDHAHYEHYGSSP